MAHQKITIGGKDVYIVEAHHHVLQGWAEVRRNQASAPALLTLDHHTDTHEPFLRHSYWETQHPLKDTTEERLAMVSTLIRAIDWANDDTVEEAIGKLKHDEHIRTAIQADILARAFVVNFKDENHADAAGHVYATCSGCDGLGCTKPIHDDDCEQARIDQLLESRHLDHELGQLNAMAQEGGEPGVEAAPYILDIDLDYFNSDKAIEPDDPSTFYRLVRGALAITIATEPGCVLELRVPGSNITADSLLARMQQHLQTALT